ncbi:hypothetical protein [Cupriavidus oxalaticus]|uniref:Uncharacterized protein n=1 Tax=Cupriavidus oxalaticus TaxID=96344 RepID=A0A375GEZ3_9BURK|nr:hypothetical protein [Cupriavidus oxalaticus]QRQ86284.1 hypothetical protein JTE91_24050 [Cupriavidus oxalaticus]QRQ95389.1 hypothetical protein JTE92_18210 [Cupriavidus oxalaticus]WQD84044.1 hypothetical protein U0036_05915 [Cupriavidus oxalaticus]SPC17356.1 hypothetical protein CO2235_90230 [Cupriavidus oxalaticus]
MATTVTIFHNGTELKVSGSYCRGYDATLEQPGEPEGFYVDTITDSGVDVTHIHDLDEIAGLALEIYLDNEAAEACEAADRQREERRFAYGVAV